MTEATSNVEMVEPVAVTPQGALRSPRRHISRALRRLVTEHLDDKYGHMCYSKGCPSMNLQIDHRDGNRNNTVLMNLQWACPRHQRVRTVARNSVSERFKAPHRIEGEEPFNSMLSTLIV